MIEIRQIDGVTEYFVDRNLHRPNGPAIIWNESKWAWWLNDTPHRYYGACSDTGKWWIHGLCVKMYGNRV
jgi:hypothetical protein